MPKVRRTGPHQSDATTNKVPRALGEKPEHSTYAIKHMDRQIWERFTSRAKGEGRTVKWLFEHFVKAYASGDYRIEGRP